MGVRHEAGVSWRAVPVVQGGDGREPAMTQLRSVDAKVERSINNLLNMSALNAWYDGMTGAQKVFVYVISLLLVLAWGAGLVPLCILIYLQLGTSGRR